MTAPAKAGRQGFFIVPEAIVDEHGDGAGILFGRIWRYCQFAGHQCFASAKTLAVECGSSPNSVRRNLDRLIEGQWITEEVRPGKTSIFRLTGRYVHGSGEDSGAFVKPTQNGYTQNGCTQNGGGGLPKMGDEEEKGRRRDFQNIAKPAFAGSASSGERLTERATDTATAEAHRPGADHDLDLVLPWEDHDEWIAPQTKPSASPTPSASPEAPQEDSHAPVVMTSSDPKWLLLSTIALDTGCGWGRQEKAPGKLRAHIGQLWGELGRRLGDDPVLALMVWEEFAGGLKQHAPSKLAPGGSANELRLWLGGRFGRAAIARARGA